MQQYWHNLITEKSFELLKKLKRKYHFILIGGWAVFLYTRALKSKDLDIVVDYQELSKLKKEIEIVKNQRLKKYEAKVEDIDIDIYLPYFSNPGLPAEEIKKYVILKEGFLVPIPEILLVLKQRVFLERKNSPKGEKDKLDIFSLLLLENFNFKKYKKILKKYNIENLISFLKEIFDQTFEIKELKISRHKMAKFKKRILTNLKNK